MGRITAAQKANLNDLDLYKTKIKDLKNKNVVWILVLVMGIHCAYANAFQEKHLIATEVYLSGIGSLIGLINKYKISNISIFDEDVRLLMDQMPKEFLDSVNILFPDPWQKANTTKDDSSVKTFCISCILYLSLMQKFLYALTGKTMPNK